MVRGNERKNLFMDEEGRARYVEALSRAAGHSSGGIKANTPRVPCFVKCDKEPFPVTFGIIISKWSNNTCR
jgi:hypothetical protein